MFTIFIEIAKFLEEHNGAISAISTVLVAAFTYTLWRATTKLWRSSLRHSQHLESSLAEASRSASAMESVAKSLETTSAINREIANRQKVVTELQSRAYLSIVFIGVVPQNRQTGYRYEPRFGMVNNGHTPAYDVSFRINADVCPVPLPADFPFSLPDAEPARSVSIIGPQQNKIMSAPLPRTYSGEEEQSIKNGVTQRIYVWGIVTYRDAFQIERSVRFSQSLVWLADGTTAMAFDTARHNEAN